MWDLAIVFVALMSAAIGCSVLLARRFDRADHEAFERAVAFMPPSESEILAARLRGADEYRAAWALFARGALGEAQHELVAVERSYPSPVSVYGEFLRAAIEALQGDIADAESRVRLARSSAQRQGLLIGPQLVDALLHALRGDRAAFEGAYGALATAERDEPTQRLLRFLRAALAYRGIDPIWPSTGDGQSAGDSPLLDIVLRTWPTVVLAQAPVAASPYRGTL